MNSEQVDLALAAMEEKHKFTSLAYAELMSSLSNLVMNQVTVENLIIAAEIREANQNMLSSFFNSLPTASEKVSNTTFRLTDAYEARKVQSFALWMAPIGSNGEADIDTAKPFFIIGGRHIEPAGEDEPDVELLLLKASSYTPKSQIKNTDDMLTKHPVREVFTARTWQTDLDRISNEQLAILTSSYTDEEVVQMFSSYSKKLHVSAGSPGSLIVVNAKKPEVETEPEQTKRSIIPFKRRRVEAEATPVPAETELTKYPHVIRVGFKPKDGLSDEDMIMYDVYDHLSDFASAFNKMDYLVAFVKKYVVNAEDPMDKLLREAKEDVES